MLGYKVMYDIKTVGGDLMPVSADHFFDPVTNRETAERVLANCQNKSLFSDRTLYIKEVETESSEPPLDHLNGFILWDSENFHTDALIIGDYVRESIVDYFVNCLPPACHRRDCTQLGEAHSHRIDENGNARTTYLTFKQVDDDLWQYCGDCFRGENVQRGTKPDYL